MAIFIENKQKLISVSTTKIRQEVTRMLAKINYANFSINIRLTDNAEIQEFNKKFRNKETPTDILSFPFYPNLKAGEQLELDEEDALELGDIIISVEQVQQDAQELEVTLEQWLKRLLAHGIAHLLGYDHKTDEDFETMKTFEDELLKEK